MDSENCEIRKWKEFMETEVRSIHHVTKRLEDKLVTEFAAYLKTRVTSKDHYATATAILLDDEELELEFNNTDDEKTYDAYVDTFNKYHGLNEICYLCLRIPREVKRKMKVHKGKERELAIASFEHNAEARQMAFVDFLQKYLKDLPNSDGHNSFCPIIKTQDALESEVKNFIEKNRSKCKQMMIVVTGHGTSRGNICIGHERMPTQSLIKMVEDLAEKNQIPIRLLLAQCHSHVHNGPTSTENITVTSVTSDDQPKNALLCKYDYEYDMEEKIYKICKVRSARNEGLENYAMDPSNRPQPPQPSQVVEIGKGSVDSKIEVQNVEPMDQDEDDDEDICMECSPLEFAK